MTGLVLALALAVFTPSATPGAVHGCEAFGRTMRLALCRDEANPQLWVPCRVMRAPFPVACSVSGGALDVAWLPKAGEAIGFCVYAETPDGRSECGDVVGVAP